MGLVPLLCFTSVGVCMNLTLSSPFSLSLSPRPSRSCHLFPPSYPPLSLPLTLPLSSITLTIITSSYIYSLLTTTAYY